MLSLLGLCRRAGRLKYGFDSVKEAVIKKEAELVVFAADLSERTRSKIERIACENGVKAVGAQFSMSELGRALGLYKSAAIAAICDKGLAELFIKKINEE